MKTAGRFEETVCARVTDEERKHIHKPAKKNDRTPSREIGRAIRFYILSPEEANEALQKME